MSFGVRRGRNQPMDVDTDTSEDEELNYDDDDERGITMDGIYIPPPQKPALSLDPKGPRYIITKIANAYFKSYAENVIIGPFHKCFNAIVGPNGSGKSNVIDSILFVFGYRATKIRCKKVSVLLHNSENLNNIQSCTVEIYFAQIIDKDGDEYEIVPGSEFVVSRTANKDNSSYYQLDGEQVQFKDISLLLKTHGIDLDHNRFLILQGEVEQIATMKNKGEKDGDTGLLEYLEDIIGTTRYIAPLSQIYEKVELLSDRRAERINRLNIVRDEMSELEAPKDEAVKFLKTENTIVKCKNILYHKSIKDIQNKVAEEQHKFQGVTEIHKELSGKLTVLNDQKKELIDKKNEHGQLYNTIKEKRDGLKETYDNACRKDNQIKEDMINKNNKRKKTKELIETDKKQLTKLEKLPQENQGYIQELQEKLIKVQQEKEAHVANKAVILQNIQHDTEGLQAEKEELQKDLVVLRKSQQDAKSELRLAESELKICKSSEEKEKTKLEDMKKLKSNTALTIEQRSAQVEELKKKIPVTQKSLNEANAQLQPTKQEQAILLNEIRIERYNLQESRNAMQASRRTTKVLESLLEAKRNGQCPGLLGRLGDLGAIDSKYDVAISTACGPLDHIVVETVDTAQWCIEFLKSRNIGRATFIALDKQEHFRNSVNTPIRTQENVPRLVDLIKVQDERVKTAFYYGLRDTLVANDLDQATEVAYGATRYRVVTLKGDLIEKSGSMSGGGKSVARGRMGQSLAAQNVDPKDLDRLEKEIQNKELRLRELRQIQGNLENKISELTPLLRQMEIDYEKFNSELQALKNQLPDLNRQIEQQQKHSKSTKADAEQVEKLSEIVQTKKGTYEAAAETAGELQVRVDAISKEITEKSTARIRAIDKSINDCTKVIEKSKTEINKLTVAIKTSERKYQATKEDIERMLKEVEEMENSLRAMKQEREELEEDTKKLATSLEEIVDQLKEKEAEFNDAKNDIEKITKEELTIKSDLVDVDEKLKSLNKILKAHDGAIKSFEIKISQLKIQKIPDQEDEVLLQEFNDEELAAYDVKTVEKEIQVAENHLKAAKPNFAIIETYFKKKEVYMQRAKELDEIIKSLTEMRKVYDDLRKRRKDEFLAGFNIINMKLKEMYQMITLGGDAEFELVDTFDPFSEGVQFNVRPPRKTWKKISNLSGGEKTLSSLALVFALHYYKPSPLYFMDEIDAALDFKNVSIVANYIKERARNTQFIIISLRSDMFELGDLLIGIYKTYNTTKAIAYNPKALVQDGPESVETPPAAANDPVETQLASADNPVETASTSVNNPVETSASVNDAVDVSEDLASEQVQDNIST